MAAAVDMSKSGLGNDFGCKLVGYSSLFLSHFTLFISGYFGPAKILPRHQRGGPWAGGYWQKLLHLLGGGILPTGGRWRSLPHRRLGQKENNEAAKDAGGGQQCHE